MDSLLAMAANVGAAWTRVKSGKKALDRITNI